MVCVNFLDESAKMLQEENEFRKIITSLKPEMTGNTIYKPSNL